MVVMVFLLGLMVRSNWCGSFMLLLLKSLSSTMFVTSGDIDWKTSSFVAGSTFDTP